jgi:AmmeMemoRadiSam system protein A
LTIMNEIVLTNEEQRTLLMLARQVIAAVVDGLPPPDLTPEQITPGMRACRAAFVTITVNGDLRGCIGRMDGGQPVWKNVQSAAALAALEDARFTPVTTSELSAIRVEVSVLSETVEIASVDEFDPRAHGIIVENGMRHALLLPQVARERGWDAETTLANACVKAGLRPDAWRDAASRLRVFTARVFSEP